MKKILMMIALALNLQGCIFAVGAAAGAAAIAVVYDHRTIGHTVEDTLITNRISKKIRAVPELHYRSHIEVTVYNHVALLTGEAPKPEWRKLAQELAQSVPDVKRVYNQIQIQGPTSSMTRTSDSWISAKIKTEMLATDELKSGDIKVETESGVVYLMGSLTHEQADTAVDIARQVSGVQKVVKIFQYRG